ncbi:MAG: iron complex transport system substrate-binding protein [Acidobacteriaceae bacterium]|jgi:iron complex transport system substrate-binding protein|nr:iron complex transport system substrate-binding protein [Acidobacteriaceae bacterium]
MMAQRFGRSLRVAALQPSVSLTLDHLGCLDSLVACTRYCLQAVPSLRERDLKVIADSWSSNTEEILSASPDLVLASVPYRLESLAAILKCGVPVLTLAPHSLADVYQDIRLLGDILHAQDRAAAVVEEMMGVFASTQDAVATAERRLVYCEEWGKPLIHSQTWVAELVSAAGGEFLGKPGSVTDADAVAAQDPDVLVFAWCGAGDRVPLGRVIEKRQWQSLRAVREGRVYCVPDEFLNTPAPNLIQGLRALAGVIHPEIFGSAQGVRALQPDGLATATSKIV